MFYAESLNEINNAIQRIEKLNIFKENEKLQNAFNLLEGKITGEKMASPLVSVIIPCYNAEKYVEEAIRSVMTQTYSNLEIIVTDDCSSDNTLMILETLAAEDSRIKVIKNEENLKIVKSLNNMIEVAQGKYIARMDADDISLPERIEKQVSFLESNPEYGLCGTNAWHIDENGKKIGKSYLPVTHEENKFYLAYYSTFYHPTIMLRSCI